MWKRYHVIKDLLSWTSIQVVNHCQNALDNKYFGLSVDKPNAPKMNLQPCFVVQARIEFHIDGFSMRFEAMCQKAREMEAILVVRWKPPNSTILRTFAEIKRPRLQIETIESFRRNGRHCGLMATVFVHTRHVEVFQHSLGSDKKLWNKELDNNFKSAGTPQIETGSPGFNLKTSGFLPLTGAPSFWFISVTWIQKPSAAVFCRHHDQTVPITIVPCSSSLWSGIRVKERNIAHLKKTFKTFWSFQH